jgi:hypothetical protein
MMTSVMVEFTVMRVAFVVEFTVMGIFFVMVVPF